jgi:hypothetical protein
MLVNLKKNIPTQMIRLVCAGKTPGPLGVYDAESSQMPTVRGMYHFPQEMDNSYITFNHRSKTISTTEKEEYVLGTSLRNT